MGERQGYRDAIERHAERIREHSEKEARANNDPSKRVFEKPLTHEQARQISIQAALRKEER